MKKVQDNVEFILREFPEARGDDFILTAYYYEFFCGVTLGTPFRAVMMKHSQYRVPAFDTIRRTRQKLQENRTDLRPSQEVQESRKEHEYKVYEYAKERI